VSCKGRHSLIITILFNIVFGFLFGILEAFSVQLFIIVSDKAVIIIFTFIIGILIKSLNLLLVIIVGFIKVVFFISISIFSLG